MVLLALLTVLCATASAEGPGDADAGDDLDNATAVGEGTWTGTIFRNSTDEDLGDFYQLPFTPGSVVEAGVSLSETSTTYLDVVYRVFDRDRAEVVAMEYPRLGMALPFAVLTNDEVGTASYYLSVVWEGSSLIEYTVNYTLTISMSNTTQDDAGSGGDAPRSQADALSIAPGEHDGSVGGIDLDWSEDANADRGDMYSLTPEAGLFVKVEMELTLASIVRERNLALALENGTGDVLEFISVGT